MDRKYSRKQDSTNLVLKIMSQNSTKWETNLAMKSVVDQIIANNKGITEKDQLDRSTKSISATKAQVYNEMLDVTEVICGAGFAYAGFKNDNGLKLKFDFSRSDLKKGTEKIACTHCVNVWAIANPLKLILVDFNLPATTCDEQKALTDAFTLLIIGPKEVRTSGKSARAEMIILFSKNDVLLNESLDSFMKTYKTAFPDFFLEYTNARYIGGWAKKKVVPPTTLKKVNVKTIKIAKPLIVDETKIDETKLDETKLDETIVNDAVVNDAVVNEAVIHETVVKESSIENTSIPDEKTEPMD